MKTFKNFKINFRFFFDFELASFMIKHLTETFVNFSSFRFTGFIIVGVFFLNKFFHFLNELTNLFTKFKIFFSYLIFWVQLRKSLLCKFNWRFLRLYHFHSERLVRWTKSSRQITTEIVLRLTRHHLSLKMTHSNFGNFTKWFTITQTFIT